MIKLIRDWRPTGRLDAGIMDASPYKGPRHINHQSELTFGTDVCSITVLFFFARVVIFCLILNFLK